MALRVTTEIRNTLKDEFLAESEEHIQRIKLLIGSYYQQKIKLKDKALVKAVIKINDDKYLENFAGSFLFMLSVMEPGDIPMQSLAGQVLPLLVPDDRLDMKKAGMYVALEMLATFSPYVTPTISKNGHLMIRSNISNKRLQIKNRDLPLEHSTNQHQQLGDFNWKMFDIPALTKLNETPMIILPIEDNKPAEPTGNPYSSEFKKQAEVVSKWIQRQEYKAMYKNKPIYFNWAADYRFRLYPVGYIFNPQGNELEKNMLGLYNGERLSTFGIIQMKKSFASAYGLDKENDTTKIDWFNNHEHNLERMQPTAKEPDTYNALLYGWNQHKKGEIVNVPVELDSTQSQLQMLSVLISSLQIAKTCNVVNNSNDKGDIVIADAYQLLADAMSDIIALKAGKSLNPTDKIVTPNGYPRLFAREEIKKTSMICGYGARDKRLKSQLKEDLKSEYDDGIYDSFIIGLNIIAPGFLDLMNSINDMWNPEWDEFVFTMPDGIDITIKPTTDDWSEYTVFDNMKITAKTTGTSKVSFSLLLFVSLIHAVDAYILRQVIERASFEIIGIHDGYRCHPNNARAMKKLYNEVLVELNEGRLMEDFIQKLTGQTVLKINQGLKSEDIMKNMYSLS